jgi:mycothiol system anti-sigma-R factor
MSAANSSLMDMRCEDVQRVVHPYLDGELDSADRVALEHHIQACAPCRELVSFQAGFKAQLRARLRHPPAPPALRAQVLAGLDEADRRGEGPSLPLRRRLIPVGGVAAAAAAALIFLTTAVETSHGRAAFVDDAIRAHEKNLPVEVGGNPDAVKTWMVGKVPVPVRPPRLAQARDAALVGARIGHLSSRDAAQLRYRVSGADVTVYVFDASNLPLTAPRRRLVDQRELYVDGDRGYNVVFYRERGVGYAFTSELGEDDLIALVAQALTEP